MHVSGGIAIVQNGFANTRSQIGSPGISSPTSASRNKHHQNNAAGDFDRSSGSSFQQKSASISPSTSSQQLHHFDASPDKSNSNIRIELEHEILRLQEELGSTKNENKLLKKEKKTMEEEMRQIKQQMTDQTANLRGQMVSLTKRLNDQSLKQDKSYFNSKPLSGSYNTARELKNLNQFNKNAVNRDTKPSVEQQQLIANQLQNSSKNSAGFAAPTFSELMRLAVSEKGEIESKSNKSNSSKTNYRSAQALSQASQLDNSSSVKTKKTINNNTNMPSKTISVSNSNLGVANSSSNATPSLVVSSVDLGNKDSFSNGVNEKKERPSTMQQYYQEDGCGNYQIDLSR